MADSQGQPMNPKSDRDEWLMAQVALGKRDHLEPLVRRYASRLLTFIRRMVGDEHRSEELFQDVFLSVWEKRKTYRFPKPFKAWVYAIAANKCRANYRGQRLRTFAPLDDDGPAASSDEPADTLIATETATIVSSAVAQLPPQQRLVVVLRVWDGLSYGEIAEIVERPEGTVRSHMHHGLAAMRKYLEPRLRA
jgi:RNA polymerase sigma-70 factor, ECF subfamily